MLNWIRTYLFRKAPVVPDENISQVKYLIVGLGNIGPDYHRTRHNIGFDVLDHIASEKEVPFTPGKLGDLATVKHKGRQLLLLKPSTFMNRSGRAVRYWLEKEKIPASRLLVIVDDIHLDTGVIRIRVKGSDGGHNGLKDIQEQLGHNNYPRLRFGVGRDFHPGQQVDYVLSKWPASEWEKLQPAIQQAAMACFDFSTLGLERTMSQYNG